MGIPDHKNHTATYFTVTWYDASGEKKGKRFDAKSIKHGDVESAQIEAGVYAAKLIQEYAPKDITASIEEHYIYSETLERLDKKKIARMFAPERVYGVDDK